jgi:hypothetical protein
MVELTGKQRDNMAPLFEGVPVWRAFIGSAIENGFGRIVVDDESDPKVAALFYSGLLIYAGDAESLRVGGIMRCFEVQPVILGHSAAWNAKIEKHLGEKIKQTKRYHLPASSLKHRVADDILAHGESGCREVREDDIDRLGPSLGWEHHTHHFRGRDDFLARGNGFVVELNGSIVSGASSFAVSRSFSECQVSTAEGERRKGYARLTSAAYLSSCARQGLETPWDAANEASVALARTLGFTKVIEYPVYEWQW